MLCLCMVGTHLSAQPTNIYAFDFKRGGDNFEILTAYNLTGFNSQGSNIDPVFASEDVLLISSNHFDKTQQDILQLDMSTKTIRRITQTEGSETRPEMLTDDQNFTVIYDSEGKKELIKYPLNLEFPGITLDQKLPSIDDYAWRKFNELYILESKTKRKLSFFDKTAGEKTVMSENVGDFVVDKYNNLIFTEVLADKTVMLKKYDTKRSKYKTYSDVEIRSTLLCYLSDHKVLTAKGSKLYLYNLASESIWEEVLDLSDYGIENIVDIKIQKNLMLIVDKS